MEGDGGTPEVRQPTGRKRRWGWIAAMVVVLVVVVAGVSVYYVTRPPARAGATFTTGGFTDGQVVALTYPSVTADPGNGSWVCTPGLTTFFPSETGALKVTPCEAGAADQSAVSGQLPQWVLVPAFAGLSIFGVTALGASSRGFPQYNGTILSTD